MREVSFLLLPSLQEWYFLPVYNYVSKPQNSVFNSPCVLWKVVWLMLIEISLWGAVVFHGLEFCWVGRLCLFIVVEEGHLSVLKCFWRWLNRSVLSLRTSVIVRTGERWLINHQKICCNVSCKKWLFSGFKPAGESKVQICNTDNRNRKYWTRCDIIYIIGEIGWMVVMAGLVLEGNASSCPRRLNFYKV